MDSLYCTIFLRRNMAKRRAKNLDEMYLGPEPLFTEESEFTQMTWSKAAGWYNYFYKSKDYMPTTYQFATDYCGFNKKKLSILKRVKDWKFMKVNKTIKLLYRGWKYDEATIETLKEFINERYKEGLKEKKVEEAKKANIVVITPAERTRRKVVETIYHDFDSEIVEGWFDGNYTQKFSAYNRFKMHGLKGNAINIFKSMIEEEYNNIKDAYDKTCDQCVEAYSHISKGNKRKIIKQLEEIFADLERLRDSFKAARIPRAKKPKSSDAQVVKLKYCQEDIDAKLTSINPILIPTKHKLYIYNRKNRKLIEYVTSATSGFEIAGTSIKNFDKQSRQATLRKPDEILPMILNKTEKQIEKIWDSITTKIDKPTGRINADCILMRVF
jgi:hypothetical protein